MGAYFLHAVFNRMVDPCSKKASPDWYRSTAIQQIRPVEIDSLNSQRYWEKSSRVAEKHLKKIAGVFLERISRLEPAESDCFLFDTTNCYTYVASETGSELAVRGKSKEGKDRLRQIGVALLVSRNKRLPLFYREYERNRRDPKVFQQILREVVAAMKVSAGGSGVLTLVFDEGMNSEENIAAIDGLERIHFITTHCPYFAEDLFHVKLSQFKPVDTSENRELEKNGKEDDRLVAYRRQGEIWNRARTVVVTYSPRTAARQRYAFNRKLMILQQTLFELRSKVQTQKAHWTD